MNFLQIPALASLLAIPCSAQIDVAVFSLNDFHASFVRNDSKGIPGAPAVVQTLDSLKRIHPYHITVSAGDNFGGSYFYNATRGELLPIFFNDLGIRISALGNHEFDDGQRVLAEKWHNNSTRPQNWDLTYVCANVRESRTGRIPEFAQPVVSIPLDLPGKKRMRIAFAGLIASSTPMQASSRNLSGLTFDGNYPAVLDSIMQLPEASLLEDANLRLLLTHNGTRMNAEGQPIWDDKDAARLSQIDSPVWQGILTSHSHQLVAGHINEAKYPVVQGKWHGEHIGMLICRLDTTRMVVTDVQARTVPVTPKAELEPGPARLQAQIDSLLHHTTTLGGMALEKQVARFGHEMPHDRDEKWQRSQVGTLVCEAYAHAFRQAAHIDNHTPVIGLSHFGSIRAGMPKGIVTVLDVGEALPFANRLKAYLLTGSQIMKIMEFGLNNQRFGWLQTSNLKVIQSANKRVTAVIYTDDRGKQHVLQLKNKYYVVADEFITLGGDGYDPNFFPADNEVKVEGMPATTDAFIHYLTEREYIP